jgi:hypothetical protein
MKRLGSDIVDCRAEGGVIAAAPYGCPYSEGLAPGVLLLSRRLRLELIQQPLQQIDRFPLLRGRPD